MSDTQPKLTPPHRPIQNYVFGAILLLLFLAVCRLFAPFFSVLLWSVLLYIIIGPLHKRLIRGIDFNTVKGKILRNFWAVVFTLGTVAIVLVPISLLVTIFFRQIAELGRAARDLLNEKPEYLRELFERISDFVRNVSAGQVIISADTIESQIKTFITNGLQSMFFVGGNIVRNIGGFSVNILIMTFSMFFFYVDGPYLSRLALRSIPIKSEYISTLTAKFMDITRNLFFGYVMVALLQSVVAYVIFSIFDIKGSLVLSALTFLLVFFPLVGATLVYVPLGILKIAGGNIVGGIIFLIVSAVFISGIDNVLRPFFLKDRIQLHPLIIFFAILGGLIVFGFNGLILGPVLVILFLTVLDLFLTEHKIDQQKEYQ